MQPAPWQSGLSAGGRHANHRKVARQDLGARQGLGGRIPNARVRPKDVRLARAQQFGRVSRNGRAQRDTDDLGGLDLPRQHAVGGSAADRANLHTCLVDRGDIGKFLSRRGDIDKADDPKVRRGIRLVRGGKDARPDSDVPFTLAEVALYRSLAGYVERILRGTSPADLPFQAPTTLYLAINQKTAKALSIDVPPTVLARADEVIE